MSDRPLVLVSNDDGVEAPGLVALREALTALGDVVTVAPEREQSGRSHAISLHAPLRHRQLAPAVHAIDGTPADCVYVALYLEALLPRRPDLVVSGINHGPNLGSDVHYSGTVAAAREAALRGVPAMAMSTMNDDFDACARLAVALCRRMLVVHAPGHDVPLLNVNFPHGEPKGVRVTRLGKRLYAEGVEVRDDPRGRRYFWIGGPGGVRHERLDGSDTDAVDAGYVSVTPLSVRSTETDHFPLAAYVAGPEREPL
ncbi:MAG: 5'/3'-nucleotidase SurE [Myxococcales bacterium]|nr:5'/3'-nucleotidase SurE [Myxococcales bacterium]